MRSFLLFSLLSGASDAFAPEQATSRPPSVALFHHAPRQPKNRMSQWATSLGVGTTIMASSFATPTTIVPVANAVEISSGAFSIQAYTGGGETLRTAGVDSTVLFKTLLKNRKELGASFERIQNAVKDELNSPVWKEIKKEVLQIEGDITSEITISPPSDFTQTFKDLSKGKVNFILNGEIVNIAVDSNIGADEDKILISVEGVKGVNLRGISPPANPLDYITGIYARRWQERSIFVSDLWDSPLGLELPGGIELTAGPVVVGGLSLTIAASYAGAYAYYSNEQEEAAKAAEEKRQVIAAKKAAAAAAKKKKEEKQE